MKKNKILQFLMAASLSSTLLFSYLAVPANAASTNLKDMPKIDRILENPKFEQQLNDSKSGKATQTIGGRTETGFLESPVELSKNNLGLLPQTTAMPAKYDLRNNGRVSSVKNQSTSGACWAFAAIGSLESCLMPKQKYDFSENNLKNNSGFSIGANEGGNNIMATAYFARWNGPVSEKSDPYDPNSTKSSTKTTLKHIQNVEWLNPRTSAKDLSSIKNAVMKHGATAVSIYMDSYFFNTSNNTYYTSNVYSQSNNHEVDIVGWDDNYSKDKFVDPYTGTKPSGNGAFIVRNSYGTSWGDNGYFYVSYYDKSIGYDGINAVYYNAESTSNYKNIYQYDTLGLTDVGTYHLDNVWYSNVFKASANEKLSAVGLYTLSPNTQYQIYVCTNYQNASSLVNARVLKAKGTISDMGYHTIKLNSSVALTSGKKFAVIVKIITPKEEAPIPIENVRNGYSDNAKASAGQSYVSKYGDKFSDIRDAYSDTTANVCLKAYTVSNSAKIVADAQDSSSVLEKFIKFSSALFGGLK